MNRANEQYGAVAQLGSSYRRRAWRDAHRRIAECHDVLAYAALISLNHDLNKEHPGSADPGDGLNVAFVSSATALHLACNSPHLECGPTLVQAQ